MGVKRAAGSGSIGEFLAASAVVLAVLGLLTVAVGRAYEGRLQAVRHSVDVQRRLLGVLSTLQDAETGQRGYLLTGESAYLGPFNTAHSRLASQTDALKRQVSDNAGQIQAVAALQPLIDAKFAELDRTIALKRAGRADEALAIVRGDSGRQLMHQLRAAIARMDLAETRLLVERSRDSLVYSYALVALLATLVVTIIAGLLIGLYRARQAAVTLGAARDDAQAARQVLENEARERARAEDQVRQMQKIEAVGQLTGGIAHDFNNMLAVVIGNLELARRRLDDKAKTLQAITYALEGATRAATLTRRLLAFSRQQPLKPQVMDLNKVVSGMSDLLFRTLGEAIEVETVLGGGLWRTCVDQGEIESAILNLANNARDAMPEGGRLTIETTNTHLDDLYAQTYPEAKAGQYVAICVSDTGTGMAPEVSARAFDPFYTTKPVGAGTGLGLSQIHGFIKQSEGHVRIYSEEGAGTTVKMYLPRYFGAEAPVSPQPDRELIPVPEGSPDRLILVVEDEEHVRRVSVETLRALGYSVRHASDGPSALKLLGDLGGVTLLFTDVVMPGMTGRQLAEAARQIQTNLKVLYTTGYTRNAVVHGGIVDPDVAFLAKPFTFEQLASKVSETIAR